MRLTAVATDGVPEAIEVEGERFCMGVQWHPEYTWETIPTDRQAVARVRRGGARLGFDHDLTAIGGDGAP